ncbi:transglycosylase SLT domain-containing protein [Synechococcus sp. MU1611]|uniref:lytic transglycosylase domain-containing protein n=1 Tax=Synechococcus sp. MU1611 TaxID=2508345 RepID=UPI001CF86188|nr:transglycosylase SLT domain-containing protein [Synechococcus sp. MU1611]MCB4410523.1 transglycosylase SLT domain-containing protein [Synechococcus sp. MU1611]
MRSRNVLIVSALTATLLGGLWLKPKQPRAEAEAFVTAPVVTAPVTLPAQATQPKTRDGRQYPLVPADTTELTMLLAAVEQALRDPATPADELPDLGHQQQVIYRVLSTDQPRAQAVINGLPPRWRSVAERHLAARREFVRMSRGRGPSMLPGWRIIQPEAADKLLSYYRKAEAATGIEWEVLAAVNLVETGMGRIDGVSVANAQGPMQFLPTTWAEPGIGAGSIRDPHDAIQAAARYLVRRGGLQDIRRGLWGYNNSDYYGRAVLLYASLMKEDPAAYTGLYHWEIHFNAAAGDLWLPVGYNQPQRISVQEYLQTNPTSRSPNR